MSIHKSLVLRGKLKRHRNVFSRSERVIILSKEGKLKEEDSVFGLSKIKNIMRKTKAKVKKKEEAAAATGEAAPATQSASAQPQAKPAQKEKTATK